jgi:uncharacterized membrane protein
MDVSPATTDLPIPERNASPARAGERSASLKTSQIVLLLLFVAAGGFLRFYRISRPSLWMDELWSIEMSMGRGSVHDHLPANVIRTDNPALTRIQSAAPWPAIWTHLAGYAHPPLYYILLRFWMELFGVSELSVRSLSALCSGLTILVFFDVCRLLHGPRVALLAAGIMSLAIAQIEFAQNARSYALLILLGVCSANLLLRLVSERPAAWRLALLTILLTALALTHYNAWGLIGALAIFAFIRASKAHRFRVMIPFVACAALVAIGWLHWMVLQLAALPSMLPTFLAETSDFHALHTLLRAIGLPGKFLIGDSFALNMPSAFYVVIAILSVAVPVVRLPWRRDALLWILWLGGTLGCIAVVDLARKSVELDYLRYTILGSPAVYALLAGVDWPSRPVVRDAVPLITLAILCLCAVTWLNEPATPKEDWRALIGDTEENAIPGELLVFYGDDPWISPGAWYLALDYYAPRSRHPWLILNHRADAALLNELATYKSVILIGPYPSSAAEHWLPGWVPITTEEQTTAGAFCRLGRMQIVHQH